MAGVVWTASQLFSAEPLLLSVPIDVGEVSFHLLVWSQFAQAIASALSSLLGFLGAARSSSLEELLSSEDGAFFFVFFFFVFLGGSLLLGVRDE